jgi:hypothetical protein
MVVIKQVGSITTTAIGRKLESLYAQTRLNGGESKKKKFSS